MTKNNKINILFNIDKRVDDRNIKNIIIYYIKSLINNGNIINYEDKKFLDLLNPITSLNHYISYLFEINELNE